MAEDGKGYFVDWMQHNDSNVKMGVNYGMHESDKISSVEKSFVITRNRNSSHIFVARVGIDDWTGNYLTLESLSDPAYVEEFESKLNEYANTPETKFEKLAAVMDRM